MFTGGAFLTNPVGELPVYSPETFTEEQKEFAQAAEDFALKEIYPKKKEIEEFNKDLVLGLFRQCGELGLLGVDVPEEYGGMALDKITSALFAEKITYGQSASFTVTFSAHTGIGTLPIVYFGNEAQKRKYLPKLASGEWLSAYALTEPGSGTDALSIQTTAKLSGDGKYYILNGTKQFISNGGWADLLITFGRIDGTKLTGFLIDPNSEGVIKHEEKNKLGLHGSSTCNIILENVKVPVEDVLGEIGKGAEIAFNILNIGRFKLGASVLAGCKTTLTESVTYAMGRKQFGQPVAYFDAIKKKVADMAIRAYSLESIVYQTAGLLDESINQVNAGTANYYRDVANAIERFALECSVCKVYGSEALWLNADEGLQIFGGYGFVEDYPIAQITRDTRVDRIYEGTNEINRQIILGYLIKKTLLEELPVREKVKEIPTILSQKTEQPGEEILAEEKKSLGIAKYLLLYVFNEALIKFGQDLTNEQQIGELLADMISDIFVMDTTLTRISQPIRKNDNRQIVTAIGKVLVAEKILTMTSSAHKALCGILEGSDLQNALNDLRKFKNRMLLNTNLMKLKKEIADFVYEQKKYPF